MGARTQSALASPDDTIGELWNPGSSRIKVYRCVFASTTGGSATIELAVQRATAKGTAAGTVTPDADNDWDRFASPPSGTTLEMGNFSTEPTLDTSMMWKMYAGSGNGSSWWVEWPFGIVVPGGTGLCVVSKSADATTGDVTFVWSE